jgi:ubiquitin-activating enzyme E1
MTQIDINLYDRQIRTYGIDAVNKLTSSSVLIYGLKGGLATEIGKNLALSGINIYLYNIDTITTEDLDTGFYYKNINSSCAKELCPKLQELNPYITVKSVDNYNQNQNVTILINQEKELILEMNEYCRQNNSKLVVLFSKGINGCIFVDANENHLITDTTGETIDSVQISEIKNNRVTSYNDSFNLQTGDYVIFDNLQGENLEQLKKEWQIKVINRKTIELIDCELKDFTFINGTVHHVKKSITINHKPFSENLNQNELINKYLNNIYDEYELMPIVSFFGSLVASEAIKLVTNKYIPISQWFSWESGLPTHGTFDCETTLGKIYGPEFEEKLLNFSWLVVGSGAIGCEHLKNLAFMGVKNIILTDPDLIEKSNLNRQFLFRNEHIGKAKSEIAAIQINKMKEINIKSYLEKVGPENNFTDKVLPTVTGVFNALDNISARKFMDQQCFNHGLPLFESGTMGTKGNTQPVIPFITETYSASNDPDQEKSFPLCTIKSFPNEIVHTIHWALDKFEFFNRAPLTLQKYTLNPNYLDELTENEKSIAEKDIKCYNKYPAYKNKLYCVKYAIDTFYEYFYDNINELLEAFPENHMIDNKLFWSAGKRCPRAFGLNISNENHYGYIFATSHLFARTFGLNYSFNKQEIYNYIINRKLEDTNNNDYTFCNQLLDKDDSSNYHILWINRTSNMRALNYEIPIIDVNQTKGIAGKIIPAIATTTSAVSGLIMIEMIKYLLNMKEYRSTFINLVDNTVVYSEPISAPMIEIAGTKINSWTKFNYTLNSTLYEFKEYYEKLFNITISMIMNDSSILYADFISENLNTNLKELIQSNIIIIMADDDIELPNINILL